ncbi:hypothetical protein N0V88_005112 [Collariella sp. IMI 366227]|nr:hypothetical protein N0V88_005112 [Collariella sp. IMI 366227]
MGESEFHYQVQAGLRDYLKDGAAELLSATEDPTLRERIQLFRSEARQHVERKARQYVELSDGKIRAVLIVDLQYKGMKKAAIVRRARHRHDLMQFSMEVGDEEDPSETRARHIAEAEQLVRYEERKEAERRVAEARNEARIEMDRWMVEMERRMNAEIKRRVAERQLEAE